MIRETDVVFDGGFRTDMPLEEYLTADSPNIRAAEICSSRPRFSWMIACDRNNTYQRKYRILVASSREIIATDRGDVWDSGFVTDSSSVAVCYGGEPLKPSALYYWKVMIVDNGGHKSAFSQPKGFVTAADLDDYTSVLPIEKTSQLPESMTVKGSSVLVDFGKDAFSQLSISLNSLTGRNTVAVHLGEDLDDNGFVNDEPYGAVRYSKYDITLRKGYVKYVIKYIPNPYNTDPNVNNGAVPVLMPSYIGEVYPFRYVQIDDYDGGPLLYSNIVRDVATYPMDYDLSDFYSSDTTLNAVWNLCKYTMKATSFAGTFVDGDRERITYEADTYINQLSYYAVSDQYSIARNTLERLMNNATWPTEWILQTLMIAYNDYLYTGDISFLEKYYNDLKIRTLYDFRDEDDNLLHSGGDITDHYLLGRINTHSTYLRDIIDWPFPERDNYDIGDCNASVNAFYYKALEVFALIAEAVGNHYDASIFQKSAQSTRAAINGNFLRPDNIYNDAIGSQHSSLHANMLPLAMGVAEDSCRASLMAYIKKCGMACSPFGAQFLLDAVYNASDPDYALDLLTDTTERSWYSMIRRGSTMTTEAWNDSLKDNLDWNHAWGASPANIISRRLMGIMPLSPGFARVRIAPQIGRLEYASIKQPTPRGVIKMNVRYDGKSKVNVSVDIPPNVTAEIVLPGARKVEIVGSGSWNFVYKRQ